MLKHRYISYVGILGIISILIAIYVAFLPFYALLIWLFLWIGISAWGSFDIRQNYFLEAYHVQKEISESKMALTFDDGPHQLTNKVLDLLKQYNMKATFFCIGKEVEKHPEIVKRIINEGHEIGNHTFTHNKQMGFKSANEVYNEIQQCSKTVQEITGKELAFFRPPFGVTNPSIAKAVQLSNMKVIGWSIRSLDTVAKSSEDILNRILSKVKKGDVVLLHDNRELTIKTLEKLLIQLQNKNLKSVTISELFRLNPYKK